jgi:hypothetical protein
VPVHTEGYAIFVTRAKGKGLFKIPRSRLENLLSSSLLSKNLKIKIHSTIILSAVLYGFANRSLTVREERRLRVFENRVLRRISGPKRDEVTGEWRKLHNEELHDLNSSPNIVRNRRLKRRWTFDEIH